jgi:predicted DCC family thiol-disulfide oxidoreductase YuxK
MNTEITDNKGNTPAGWIFFDADCRFCVANRVRWGRIFERRGFVWVPMQTPGTTERLGITAEMLTAEMWVLPVGAPPLNGVDAWIGLMRHVWWLKPLAVAIGLPGIKRLAQSGYRWIARNRYCIAGRCRTSPRQPRGQHRHDAFLKLP